MCGRFTRQYTWEQVRDFLDLRFPDETGLRAKYNVAPTHRSPIVLEFDGKRGMQCATWGLVPSWADDPKIGSRMINARAETVAEKPAFRSAYRHRRCVVPVSGFYEWTKTGTKKPYYITRADGAIMLFAGLWERWEKSAEPLETFTIITTEANAQVGEIHPRMPVILEPESVGAWLSLDAEGSTAKDPRTGLLRAAADGTLVMHEVSGRVGNVRNDDGRLVEALSGEKGLFGTALETESTEHT